MCDFCRFAVCSPAKACLLAVLAIGYVVLFSVLSFNTGHGAAFGAVASLLGVTAVGSSMAVLAFAAV